MNPNQNCPKCNSIDSLEHDPALNMFYCKVCSVQISTEELYGEKYKPIIKQNLMEANYEDSTYRTTCSNCKYAKRLNRETHCANKIIMKAEGIDDNPPTTVKVSLTGHCKHYEWDIGYRLSNEVLNDIFITWWT